MPERRLALHPPPLGTHAGVGVMYTATRSRTALAEVYLEEHILRSAGGATIASWTPFRRVRRLRSRKPGWAGGGVYETDDDAGRVGARSRRSTVAVACIASPRCDWRRCRRGDRGAATNLPCDEGVSPRRKFPKLASVSTHQSSATNDLAAAMTSRARSSARASAGLTSSSCGFIPINHARMVEGDSANARSSTICIASRTRCSS